MWRGVAVVAGISSVDGKCLDGGMLVEQLQGVVHRCFRQGRHTWSERRVDFVHGGMCMVVHQILHDGYPLYRGLYAVTLQTFNNIHIRSFQSCNDYIFNSDAKIVTSFYLPKVFPFFSWSY